MQTRGSMTIEFIDFSSLQGITNQSLLLSKLAGKCAILRCYGSSHSARDTQFVTRAQLLANNGIPSGGYYFATPTTDPATDGGAEAIAQADQFIAGLQAGYGSGKYGDLVPMLDLEAWGTTTPQAPMYYGMTGQKIIEWVKIFRDHFFNVTGRRLGFYSNRDFLQNASNMALTDAQLNELSNMPLWLAEYDTWYPANTAPTGAPASLGGWTTFVAWQYNVIADADQWGLNHSENKVDHNFTDNLDRLLIPPAPTIDKIEQTTDNQITVTYTRPNIIDYLGADLYINGVWKKWGAKTANLQNTFTFDITTYARNQNVTVQVVVEDSYSDFGRSLTKDFLIFPTKAEADAYYYPPVTPEEPNPDPIPTEGAAHMPKRTTGVTGASLNRFVIDAGAVYVNFGETDERLLGATRGGNTFSIEVEMREMEIDGIRQAVKGTKRVTNVEATITTNLLELSPENLALSLTGATIGTWTAEGATAATHDTIRRSREIGTMDYIKNIAIVGKVNNTGENFIGIIYNALATGGLEVAMEDDNESAIEVTFTAHIDPDDIADDGSYMEAWEIRMPTAPAV